MSKKRLLTIISRAITIAGLASITLTARPERALAAIDAQDANRFKAAQRLIEQDAAQAYALAKALPRFKHSDDVRLLLLAQSAHHSGQVQEAVSYYLEYAQATPDSTEAFKARQGAAELMVLLGDLERADELLKRLDSQKRALKTRFTTRRGLFARVLRMRHDLALAQSPPGKPSAQAQAFARQLLLLLPAEPETKRQGLSLGPDDLSDADKVRYGQALYDAWSYREARQIFAPFEDHPKYGEKARWHLAQIALNKLRDDFPKAERLFKTLLEVKPYAAEAQFQYGRALMRQERYAESIKALDRYVARFPRGEHVETVHYYRGWLPYDHRENERAIKELNAYIDRYGRRGSKSSYIYGFRAWTYMRMHKWDEAIDAFEQLMPFGNPLVAGKALYWQAYAYEQLQKPEQATKKLDQLRRQYPVSYYGMLGEQLRAKMSGQDQRASKVWWPEGAGSYDFSPRVKVASLPEHKLSSGDRARWERVKELVQLEEKELAKEALSPIREKLLRLVPSQEYDAWVHALGIFVDDYNKMWQIGAKNTISYLRPVPDANPLHAVMAYPQAYPEVVKTVAREFELPPYLIWSIMRQESRYKPSAISHTDAVGALQMIPQTARKVAQDLNTEYNPRTFHYPEVGFRFSAFYMRKLLDTFGGLFVPMAGSYNSGPKTIARWFKKNPEAEFAWLIEEFEYNEGRSYSRKVGEHLLRYIYLYEADEAKRAALLDKMFPLSRDITIPEQVGY